MGFSFLYLLVVHLKVILVSLKQRRKGPETRDEFIKRLPFQSFKVLTNCLAWIAEPLPVHLRSSADGARSQIQNMCEKFIWVLGRNAILLKVFFWKIIEIVGDNHVGPATDGGGQNVSVLWIGQLERGDEVFEILDQAVAHMNIHQFPGVLQNVGR